MVRARYPPRCRSTSALATRFHWYTAAGVLLWAIQAASPGYPGGSMFASRPVLGLLLAWGFALVVSGLAVLLQHRLPNPADRHRRHAVPEPDRVRSI
jgi:membrane protein DedA with SNARE-associated domain